VAVCQPAHIKKLKKEKKTEVFPTTYEVMNIMISYHTRVTTPNSGNNSSSVFT
jgi:hypothetical protein